MNDSASDMDENKLPSTINTLTILTFVGSGLGIVSGIWSYFKSASNLAKMQEMVNSPQFEKMPNFAKKMYSPEALELYRKVDENKLPIGIVNFLGCALCIYGALEMRKLKKNGFYTYCIGEVLPFVGTLLFIGADFFKSGWTAYSTAAFAALFIILYAAQMKLMTKQ